MAFTQHPLHQAGWERFITQCLSMSNDTDLRLLLDLLLTEEEKETLATRALIIDALLDAKQTQRDIAETLQVSISKITRGSNMLKRMPAEFLKKL